MCLPAFLQQMGVVRPIEDTAGDKVGCGELDGSRQDTPKQRSICAVVILSVTSRPNVQA